MVGSWSDRTIAVETRVSDAVEVARAVKTTLNGLVADMQVTREILQRLEAASRGKRAPP